MKEKLKFEDIFIGMTVIDDCGDTGKITEIYSIHDVLVEYDNDGGSGLYCFDDKCDEKIVHPEPNLYRI